MENNPSKFNSLNKNNMGWFSGSISPPDEREIEVIESEKFKYLEKQITEIYKTLYLMADKLGYELKYIPPKPVEDKNEIVFKKKPLKGKNK